MRKTVQIPGLQPNSEYAVQFRGIDSDGNPGQWSSQFRFNTVVDEMAPAPVTSLSVEPVGPDFVISWVGPTTNDDGSPLDDLRDYQVSITANSTTRVQYTVDVGFVLSFSRNRDLFGTAQPEISVTVQARDRVGNLSSAVTQPGTNPVPTAPALTSSAKRNAVELFWTDAFSGDGLRYEIWKNGSFHSSVSPETLTWTDTDVTDNGANPGAQNYYVKAVDMFGQTADSNTVVQTEITLDLEGDTIAPKPPTNLDYSDVVEGLVATATLSWDGPTEDEDDTDYTDNEGFQVRYRKDPSRPWTFIIVPDERVDATVPQNFEVDITIPAGGTLYWGVRAFDRSGNFSTWATSSDSVGEDTTPPAVPSGLSASGGIKTIVASWSPNTEDDLAGYRLYASQTNGFTPGAGNLVFEGLGTTASFAVGENETWYVRVSAFDVAGNESTASAQQTATSLSLDAIDPPANVTFPSGGLTSNVYFHGSTEYALIEGSWTAVSGVTGYVFAWRESGGSWTEEFVGSNYAKVAGLEPGKTYEARVKAYNGALSPGWSTTRSTTAASTITTNPATVTGVTASAGLSKVVFAWNEITTPEHNDYYLQVATNSAFTANVRNIYVKTTEYHFTGVAGTTYYGRVRARSQFGLLSASWSSTVSATAAGVVTDDIEEVDLGDAAFVGRLSADQIIVGSGTEFDSNYDPTTKETPAGAQAKADAAESAANAYTDGEVSSAITTAEGYSDAIEEAIRGDFTGSATGTQIIGSAITTGTITADLLQSDIAIINGLRVQSLFEINTAGVIQSENFHATNKTGFRITNTGAELYQGSIILGGSGLNINTESDQLWFGNSAFNNAPWRVDGSGNMRVGGDGSFYADSAGNIWSGHATMASAPWEITAGGAARFDNIRITGDDLANNQYLITAGSEFVVQKKSGGFELRLAGDLFVDAGGDLQLSGGDFTMTSGNFAMNGGEMSLAGGSVLFEGAPVTIDGSNLTIESGGIIVDSGVSTSTPAIKSDNFDYATREGWALDAGNLYLFSGEIDASKITIQDGANILEHGYTTFLNETDWYALNLESDAAVAQSSLWSRYGTASLNINGSQDDITWFAKPSEYSIPVESSTAYIGSLYAHNPTGSAISLRLVFEDDDSGTLNGSTTTVGAGAVVRLSDVFTTASGAAWAKMGVEIRSATANFYVDGGQFELRAGGFTEPSTFKVGGVTSISAGQITTGFIDADRIEAETITGDKIAAGAITADMIGVGAIGSEITFGDGSFSSGGMVMDEAGIRFFNINGDVTIDLNAQSGAGTFSGAMTGGSITISDGSTEQEEYRDFAADNTGFVPDGFTHDQGEDEAEIVFVSGATGFQTFRATVDDTDKTGLCHYIWDDVEDVYNLDLTFRVRGEDLAGEGVPGGEAPIASIAVRRDSSADRAILVNVFSPNETVEPNNIHRIAVQQSPSEVYVNVGFEILQRSIEPDSDGWVNVRFQATGHTYRLKAWGSGPEPEFWATSSSEWVTSAGPVSVGLGLGGGGSSPVPSVLNSYSELDFIDIVTTTGGFSVGTDGRIWVGSDNYLTAPFRVSPDGTAILQGAEISDNLLWYRADPFGAGSIGLNSSAEFLIRADFNTLLLDGWGIYAFLNEGNFTIDDRVIIDNANYRRHLMLERGDLDTEFTPSSATTLGLNPGDQGLRIIQDDQVNPVIGPDGLAVRGRVVATENSGSQSAPTYTLGTSNTGIYYASGGAQGSGAGMFFSTGGQWRLGIGTAHSVWSHPQIPNSDADITLGSSSRRWQVCRAASHNTSSDIKLKTDIEDSDLGLEWVNRLRPVKYRWKDGGGDGPGERPHYGFIAQDIKALIDETGKDFGGFDDPSIDPAKSLQEPDEPVNFGLSYAEFIGPLVKAVQELTAEVESLKAQLA